MTREEAIKAMVMDGKSVVYRIDRHSCDNVWFFKDGYFFRGSSEHDPNLMVADGYELYTQPKQKVKMWQWVVSNGPMIRTTDSFFASEKECADIVCPDEHIVQRADWTEIEVEV